MFTLLSFDEIIWEAAESVNIKALRRLYCIYVGGKNPADVL